MSTVDILTDRWRSVRWFAWIGTSGIIAGGLVAALTGPLDLADGSWAAAYLVLVVGVAQIALGAGQGLLAAVRPSDAVVRVELLMWNLGAVATIVGTFVGSPSVTTVGAVATAIALVLFLIAVRSSSAATSGWLAGLYRAVAAVVLVSIPIGVVLSWTRHG